MKKIIGIVLAVALVLALAVPTFANVNLDAVGGSLTKGSSEVQINPGDKLYIIGWAYCDEEVSALQEMFYTVDGVEKALPDIYRDRTDVDAAFPGKVADGGRHAGFGLDANLMELTGIDTLADGTYEIKICARFENGAVEVGHTFTLIVGEGGGAAATTEYTAAAGTNSPVDGKAIWMNQPGEYAVAEFTTTGSFRSIKLTTYWASEMSNNVPVDYTLDLYKFEYNVENSLAQAPYKTASFRAVTNGNPPAVLDLGEDVPAGTYLFKVSVGGEYLDGTNSGSYMVLDHAEDSVPNVKYIVNVANKGNETFGFIVVANTVEGDFFAANPDDTEVPSQHTTEQPQTGEVTPPQTGDAAVAMIAVIAVLAMGAAVVFAKKRSF
jgi:LPXTG-motif cell wall-anchored protein